MGEMRVMGMVGDTKLIWDSTNEEERKAAEETFKRLTKKGYKAFHVDSEGEKAKRMYDWDPYAQKVILVPAMVGG